MYHFWYTGPRLAISATRAFRAKQKYMGPQRVALLDTGTTHNHLTVIVQQGGLLAIAPVSPVDEPGKLLTGGAHESVAAHPVKSIAEVDLQKPQI